MITDHDAERKVLAGTLISEDPHAHIRVIDLPADAFTGEFYRHVWLAMQELHEEREEINLATIRFFISDRWPQVYEPTKGGIKELGARLADLLEGVPSHTYIQAAVKRVRNLGYRREMAGLAADALAWAGNPDVKIGDATMRHARRSREMYDKWGHEGARGTAAGVVDRLARFYSVDADKAVRTGYLRLDDALGEVHPGTVMTILARPAVGKSNLGLNIISNWLEQTKDWGMLFCSMEMPETLASSRLIRMTEGWTSDQLHEQLRAGKKPSKFLTKSDGRLVISERGGLNMERLDEEFKRSEVALGTTVRAVVLDYLQMMRGANYRQKRYEQLATLTAELKEFAKRKDVLLVVLSQVGRGDAGGGGYKCPSVQSARDSGTIEENADFVLGIWRPDMKKGCSMDLAGMINALVLKGRNGGVNSQVVLRFDENTLRMSESFLPVREA